MHIIATRPHRMENCEVVLVHLPDNKATPYVTWVRNKTINNSYSWGHYHKDIVEAATDWRDR